MRAPLSTSGWLEDRVPAWQRPNRKSAVAQAFQGVKSSPRRWVPLSIAVVLFIYLLTPSRHRTRSSDLNHITLPDGTIPNEEELTPPGTVVIPPPLLAELEPVSNETWEERADKVKDAFVYAYSGYRKHAWKSDELAPVWGGAVNNLNGWGLTVFDSLDTIWLMGLREEWDEAITFVANVTFEQNRYDFAPFFETVIRYLGGILSAHALSKDAMLLNKAALLGNALSPAFDSPSGFPLYSVNTVTGNMKGGWQGDTLFSEIMSCQLEYKYLAHLTSRGSFFHEAQKVVDAVIDADVEGAAFPTHWNSDTGMPKDRHFSVGSQADSGFEYLLKQYLLSGQTEESMRKLYMKSMKTVIEQLFFVSPNRELLYATDANAGLPRYRLEHLTCFLPGVLALGTYTLHMSAGERELHSWAAQGLGYTCWLLYADQVSGLAPDEVSFHHNYEDVNDRGRWLDRLEQWENNGREGGMPPGVKEVAPSKEGENKDYYFIKESFLLRPETVESFFVLWRTTNDERWRHRAWSIFEAIEKHAKTDFGYATVNKVDSKETKFGTDMPSWFLAETLKYLYLTFSAKDVLPLNEFVFNTEGHPFPVFNWTSTEKSEYGIS